MVRGSGLKIGRILGIPIYLHPSWFIIFALITLSLGQQFASLHPQWTSTQHWTIGILTSLLFFGSVLFHELGHSVVALRYKIPVVSITLFVFGGIAQISREPDNARQEFNIAVAGPVASFVLAGGFWAMTRLFPASVMLGALATWLMGINAILGAFNLVPGFPLDGGRILRAIVWGWTKNYTRSTKIAARGGQLVAYGMILMGIWWSLRHDFFSGLWMAFIGWFLLTAAQESYAQVAIRNALEGLRAADIMSQELPLVRRDLSLDDYSQELVRTGRRCHLVVADSQLVGLMSVHRLNQVPREEWPVTSIQAAMLPRNQIHWASPDEPALGLLQRMQGQDVNQMPVIEGGSVVGMITRESILRVIQMRTAPGHLTS